MVSKTTVPYYGIHWDEMGVGWLLQYNEGTNALGINEEVPFIVRLPGRNQECNHQIPTDKVKLHEYQIDRFNYFLKDPLVQTMLPVPPDLLEDKAFFMADTKDGVLKHLHILARITSPIHPIVKPIWTMRLNEIQYELSRSNVQPLVLVGVTRQYKRLMDDVVLFSAGGVRRVIFVGPDDMVMPNHMVRMKPSWITSLEVEDLLHLPWHLLGALVSQKVQKNEWENKI